MTLATLRIEGIQAVIDLLLRIVSHATGVEEYGICLTEFLSRLIASHLHDGGHDFGVCHIHLAAIRFNI